MDRSKRGKMGRQAKGSGGGKMASTLLKAIGSAERRRKKAGSSSSAEDDDDEDMEGDVYEYEEGVPEEERGANRRFDDVERTEYELPSDFEDEEIDEDAAFGSDAEEEAAATRARQATAEEVDLFSEDESEGEDLNDENEDDDAEEEEDDIEENAIEKNAMEEDDIEEDANEDEDRKRRRLVEDVTGMAAPEGRRAKRRVVREAYPESEFNLKPSAGITVEDLMAPLRDKGGFGALRKRMEQLERKGGPLEVPLPKVVRERLSRKAGYEKTSEDVTKWQDVVKANREAPTRDFIDRELAPAKTAAPLGCDFKAGTDLEREIQAVLREGKQDAHAVVAAEGPALNKLTVEEVRERQARLARMRHLLFRHEQKAKRVRKIKSKTFHRLLLKGERAKAVSAPAEADPEAAKAAAMKMEFNRARERMTLKHKNSTRWAKRILKRGIKGSESGGREAIAEQLQTHAALTRKIQSAVESGSEDESSSGSEDEGEDNGEVGGRSRVLAKAKVATLKALEDGDDEAQNTGLFALPFMAKAIEKKRKSAQNEAAKVLKQLEEAEEEDDLRVLDEDSEKGQEGQGSGRVSFAAGKGAIAVGRRGGTGDAENEPDDDSGNESSEDLAKIPGRRKGLSNEKDHDAEAGERLQAHEDHQLEARQLDGTPRNGRVSAVGVETVPVNDVKRVVVSIAGAERPPQSRSVALVDEEKGTEKDNNSTSNRQNSAPSTFSDDDSDADGQDEEEAGNDQQKWIKEAFAGDDVEAEFENVKSEILQEEVPREEGPLSLPGWGQWTSVQRKVGQPKWIMAEKAALERKRERGLSKRKDANIKHVIISEKMDKKAAKFTAPSVPYPYSSREVFEGSMRMPIGRDYNTDKAYRDMIASAVVKRTGQIIDPITLDKSALKKQTEATAQAGKKKGLAAKTPRGKAKTPRGKDKSQVQKVR